MEKLKLVTIKNHYTKYNITKTKLKNYQDTITQDTSQKKKYYTTHQIKTT